MQNMIKNNQEAPFEFTPEKIQKVSIEQVVPNDWNPKEASSQEMENIKKSLEINGYAQPILVREKDGSFEIIDGFHRFSALKELGYKELYIYNAGKISDEQAKAMTIWMQTQVAFDDIQLAPLVMELNSLNFELPYDDKEIEKFKDLTQFDFGDYDTTGPQQQENLDDEFKTLTIKMTSEQFEDVQNAIKTVSEGDNVSEGRSLQLLCVNGLNGYPFDGTGDIELNEENL